ncbi:exopolyphosphatase/guanosine-5'-triphosphate,3'-diphosphate pyrophosphatase [Sphingomonas jinjuensis]|uniref:Exopolyphosphatase/guanosine-5'-triphosphate, 3'-diphosphate pyrophosphatase n=1 Tax=Sphingomonas jinjuensis TaxID=535907 RepID=A0A840FE98_9SPHN|nr:Ppx/GppA phosphatase family protein [Sphingomonas jinjuensis]MBB4154064.1 exopolyphosphatase/guanosine-5'-triphosphate,3'-diphosphate pyrophosphatase [Sphingomonas jinjuensis]
MTLPLLRRSPAARPAEGRRAIIDIGSNSVRLVVYQGHPRVPAIIYNEKVMAGLGRSLGATGAIDAEAMATGTAALARFAALAREMDADLRVVATAAVRDASNGPEFVASAKALGLAVELLSGEQEAVAAGEGVLSAIPDADGIVGDLGGGSLELVRIVAGTVTDRASFPLGVLRIAGQRGKGLDRLVAGLLKKAGWAGRGRGLPVYLVGGSWRALAKLDMNQSGYPLPIIHGYAMSAVTVTRLGRTIAHLAKPRLRAIAELSASRAATLGDAAALLSLLMRELGSDRAIVSAFGLREGLLHGALDAATRRLDPLIVAAREEGRALGRFPEHGDLIDRWIAPLFAAESEAEARVRHAACLLADVGWRANPEFRDERGAEIVLHGNWVAIEAAERAMLAQAVYSSLGGNEMAPVPIPVLAGAERRLLAYRWGMAIRFGQRLSAGMAGPLERSSLSADGDTLVLTLKEADRALYSEAVQRRHGALAAALGLEAVARIA